MLNLPFVRRFRHLEIGCGTWLLAVSFCTGIDSAAEPPPSFSGIIDRHVKNMFHEVAEYVEKHPEAADAEQAYAWLFHTARLHGLEDQAVPLVERFLEREGLDEQARAQALRVRSLGLAKSGRLKDALADFDEQMRSVRLRFPSEAVEFALDLATQAQLSGDVGAVREILERLSRAFFLNPGVRELCEVRLAKLELVGQAAPKIDVDDIAGQPVQLADYAGRVLLVDFWATNCAPCLEEFPQLKQLYADNKEKGFEIVGISLDDSPETVAEFQQEWKLPWRLVWNERELDRLRDRYHVRTIPAMYLVDQQGNIAYFDVRGHDLRTAVERLLKKQQP